MNSISSNNYTNLFDPGAGTFEPTTDSSSGLFQQVSGQCQQLLDATLAQICQERVSKAYEACSSDSDSEICNSALRALTYFIEVGSKEIMPRLIVCRQLEASAHDEVLQACLLSTYGVFKSCSAPDTTALCTRTKEEFNKVLGRLSACTLLDTKNTLEKCTLSVATAFEECRINPVSEVCLLMKKIRNYGFNGGFKAYGNMMTECLAENTPSTCEDGGNKVLVACAYSPGNVCEYAIAKFRQLFSRRGFTTIKAE